MFLNLDLLSELSNNKVEMHYSEREDCVSLIKGYEIIEHAYELLKHKSNFYCEDIISNLRKAINYRLRDLSKNLGIDKLNFTDLKKNKKLKN